MKTNTIPKLTEEIALEVAKAWLDRCELDLKFGDTPKKLSPQAETLVGDCIAHLFTKDIADKLNIPAIAKRSVEIARHYLLIGRYPTVREFFKIELDVEHNDSKLDNQPLPGEAEVHFLLRMAVQEGSHHVCCDYRLHFDPLKRIPFAHRRKWAARRAELLQDAPPCSCWYGKAVEYLKKEVA